ncbi:putative LSM1 protein [Paratrimastix pyriformis]|uniref:U6 snRNA-associated Sm-like protein LSm1 n=1 Tax=Paratrimastix pyriformis TaxID=342808 RepID=A0ABQ8UL98_9EUKA|nr:putative LSM1 protein [Paratrimastix pyriformis]
MNFIAGGTAALSESLDKKVLVVLRDGKKLIGFLRTFDQFANIVLESCVERLYHENTYGDVPLGLQIVRGDSIVILGEIDPTLEPPPTMQEVDASSIMESQEEHQRESDERAKILKQFLAGRGLVPEATLEDLAT